MNIKLLKNTFFKKSMNSVLLGLLLFTIQLTFIDTILSVVNSNELTLGFFFLFWLSGMGVGGLTVKKGDFLLKTTILLPLSLFGLFFIYHSRYFLGISEISYFSITDILKLFTISILPVSFLSGTILPTLKGKFEKRLLSFEALGSLFAGVLYYFGFLSFLNINYLYFLIIAPAIILLLLLNFKFSKNRFIYISGFTTIIVSSLIFTNFINKNSYKGTLLKSFKNQYGKTDIIKTKNNTLTIIKNGEFSYVFPPIFRSESLKLIRFFSKNLKGNIKVIDNFPLAYELAGNLKNIFSLSNDTQASSYLLQIEKKKSSLKLIKGDPFQTIGRFNSLVITNSIYPKTLKESKYSTKEFYNLCKKSLLPEGYLIIPINIPGLYPKKPFLTNISIVLNSLKAIFNNVNLIIEDRVWIVASSKGIIPITKEEYLKLGEKKISSVIQNNKILLNQLDKTADISTLNKPILLINSISIFSSPAWGILLNGVKNKEGKILFVISGKSVPYIIFVLVILLLFYFRKYRNPESIEKIGDISLLIFLTGFISMSSQIFMFFSIQSGSGNILKDIGIVSGIFMFSYSIGAFKPKFKRYKKFELTLFSSIFAISSILIPIILIHHSVSFIIIILLSSFSGIATGSLISVFFSFITRTNNRFSLIYSLEIIGAGFGALLSGSLFIPSIGAIGYFSYLSLLFATVVFFFLFNFFKNTKTITLRSRTFPWPGFSASLFIFFTTAILLSTYIHHQNKTVKPIAQKGEKFKETPFPHYELVKKGEKFYKINTLILEETKNLKGFAAPIETEILFNSKGVIENVLIKSNKETPSFIKRVKKWVKKFNHSKPSRDFYGKDGIDTISGATMSTSAVKTSIHRARNLLFKKILKIAQKKSSKKAISFPLKQVILILILIILSIISMFFVNRLFRIIVIFSSFLILGVYLNTMFSLVDIGLLLENIFPVAIYKFILLAGLFLLVFLFGPVWCGYLCPFGAAQELFFTFTKLIKNLFQKRMNLSDTLSAESTPPNLKTKNYFSYSKYILLGISLTGFAFTASQKFLDWDPMTFAFFHEIHGGFRLFSLLSIITFSLIIFRPHCTYICPVGALITLLGIFSPLKRFFPIRKIKDCDYNVKSTKDITCIRCNRCAIKRKKIVKN